MASKYPVTTVAGIASVATCIALALAAWVPYPHSFSPLTNWISDLGNMVLNPDGALLFRIDMVLVGVGLAAFFLGLGALTRGQPFVTRALVVAGQIAGIVAAVAVVMTGVFSEDQANAHALWATTLFISLAVAVLLLGVGALLHPKVPSRIGYFALAVCAVDVVSSVARTYWLEWVAVPLLLVFVARVAYDARRLPTAPTAEVTA